MQLPTGAPRARVSINLKTSEQVCHSSRLRGELAPLQALLFRKPDKLLLRPYELGVLAISPSSYPVSPSLDATGDSLVGVCARSSCFRQVKPWETTGRREGHTWAGEIMPTTPTLLFCFLGIGVWSVVWHFFPIVPMLSLEPSWTSPSGRMVWGTCSSRSEVVPLAMMKTPMKVAAHPYKKVMIAWNPAFLKSPYRMALPVIADRVKNTNWIGITVCTINLNVSRETDQRTHLAVEAHQCSVEIPDLPDPSAQKYLDIRILSKNSTWRTARAYKNERIRDPLRKNPIPTEWNESGKCFRR